MISRLKEFIHRHKKWEPLVFFVCGFSFDALLLHRIDDPLMLTHQAIYLSLAATIIAWDLFFDAGCATVPQWLLKVWTYREGILHFILGTLLNVYTIFYFKSGSILSSIIFLGLLAGLLFLNEVRPTHISKHVLRNALFSLCLISYLNIVVSIIIGSIGPWVFLTAVAVAGLILFAYSIFIARRIEARQVARNIRLPFLVVILTYTCLYLAKILPPVPLSLKHIGIYHDVTRVEGGYRLGSMKPNWKFWQSGDQDFKARAGDKLFCFVQIFSPTRFKDQLFVHWFFDDPKLGWTSSDSIALNVVGGRAEGYRGFASKSNYQPGDWRISIETKDGRELGRIGMTVSEDHEPTAPNLDYEIR